MAGEITFGFDEAFFTGTAASADASEVPGFYEIALDGVPYLVDWKTDEVLQYSYRFKHETLPITRTQADNSTVPGEHSLSPDGLWRRAMESWHHGAGQTYFDRPDSDPYRFHESRGIDVWDKYKLRLLPACSAITDSGRPSGTRVYLAAAKRKVYGIGTGSDGAKWCDDIDPESWSDVAVDGGDPEDLASPYKICSDGYHTYVASGNGIARIIDTTATLDWCTIVADVGGGSITAMKYVNGYLLVGIDNQVYSIAADGTYTTFGNADLNDGGTFFDFAGGRGAIYAAFGSDGYHGHSYIYRYTIDPDIGSVTAMVVAELPYGEDVVALQEYLGFLLIGTWTGWRLATPGDSAGHLTLGARVRSGSGPTLCFVPSDRFVWFGMNINESPRFCGFGRMDLTVINDGGAPAWAADIGMDGVHGETTSAVILAEPDDVSLAEEPRILFSASDGELYVRAPKDSGITNGLHTQTKVASGWITSGLITYGLPDTKIAVQLDIRHERMESDEGNHVEYLSLDGGDFVEIGSHEATGGALGEGMTTAQREADRIEVKHVLTPGTSSDPDASEDNSGTPVITRVTLKSTPRVGTILQIQVPIILASVEQIDTATRRRDPNVLYDGILALRASQRVVRYQERDHTYSVVVEDVLLFPGDFDQDGKMLNGTCVLRLKTLDI
jgi:hypothetical protein